MKSVDEISDNIKAELRLAILLVTATCAGLATFFWFASSSTETFLLLLAFLAVLWAIAVGVSILKSRLRDDWDFQLHTQLLFGSDIREGAAVFLRSYGTTSVDTSVRWNVDGLFEDRVLLTSNGQQKLVHIGSCVPVDAV